MKLKRMFTTIDTHVNGDTTRTVTGGLPYIPGKTVEEKRNYLKKEKDWIRKVLIFEPRGKEVQSGAIITEPCSKEADVGVVFIDTDGYPKCGDYNIIGAATALIESGLVEAKEPFTSINIETFKGIIKVIAKIEKQNVKNITFATSVSFLKEEKIELEITEIGKINIDLFISDGVYAQVEADDLNLEEIDMDKIKYYCEIIKSKLSANVKSTYLNSDGEDDGVHLLICNFKKLNNNSQKSICMLPNGFVSRSTKTGGTSARIGSLYNKGLLKKEEKFNHISAITNGTISGKVIKEEVIEDNIQLTVEITARAFLIGMHTFVIDPEDTIQDGFKIYK